MKTLLLSICILLAVGPLLASAQQPQTNCAPEFIIENADPQSGYGPAGGNILIKQGGQLVKKFRAAHPDFANVVAKWTGSDGDYVVLRSSMSQGPACGDFYVIAFTQTMVKSSISPNYVEQNAVKVSPALLACGEFPAVAFTYTTTGELSINVAGNVLHGAAAAWTANTRWRKLKT